MRRLCGIVIATAGTVICYGSMAHFSPRTVGASAGGVAGVGSVRAESPMLEPRSGHSATLLQNGKVLIAGGMRRNQDFYRSAELYDSATGKFQATGSMGIARVGHAAVLLTSGKVLIVGGWVGGHDTTDSAELYDPATGKFTAIAKMTIKRARPSATLLGNGDVLITGGEAYDSLEGVIPAAEVFRTAASRFEAVGAMHDARTGQTATLLSDGRVLIVGGRGTSLRASAEIYDSATKQFAVTGSMLTARYKHSAGLLPDGRVLILGGSDERDWHGQLNSAEIYDPHTGKFGATSSLNDSRFKLPEEAVQLTSGKILVAGGSKDVEVYDPASGKFLIAAGEMNDAWHYITETKLRDGNVLLTGGYPDNDHTTAETWIYRP